MALWLIICTFINKLGCCFAFDTALVCLMKIFTKKSLDSKMNKFFKIFGEMNFQKARLLHILTKKKPSIVNYSSQSSKKFQDSVPYSNPPITSSMISHLWYSHWEAIQKKSGLKSNLLVRWLSQEFFSWISSLKKGTCSRSFLLKIFQMPFSWSDYLQ